MDNGRVDAEKIAGILEMLGLKKETDLGQSAATGAALGGAVSLPQVIRNMRRGGRMLPSLVPALIGGGSGAAAGALYSNTRNIQDGSSSPVIKQLAAATGYMPAVTPDGVSFDSLLTGLASGSVAGGLSSVALHALAPLLSRGKIRADNAWSAFKNKPGIGRTVKDVPPWRDPRSGSYGSHRRSPYAPQGLFGTRYEIGSLMGIPVGLGVGAIEPILGKSSSDAAFTEGFITKLGELSSKGVEAP